MQAVSLFSPTSPASQDLFPVNDTIEYVEIAMLQSAEKKWLSETEKKTAQARVAGKLTRAGSWLADETDIFTMIG